MGTTASDKVRAADVLLAEREGEVLELKNGLALAAARSVEADKLLARAAQLLAALAGDIKNIGDDLGADYDLRLFQALHDQIDRVLKDVGSIQLVHLGQTITGCLRPGWQAVEGRGQFAWYRGTSLDNAIEVLRAKHFDPDYQGSGAYFGVGTYFADTYADALNYVNNRYSGKGCVFGMNVSGLRVLKARHLKHPLPAAPPPPGWLRMSNVEFDGELAYDAEQRIRDTMNTAKTLVQLAKESDYQAVEWLETEEGHLFVVVIELPLTAVDVVLIAS